MFLSLLLLFTLLHEQSFREQSPQDLTRDILEQGNYQTQLPDQPGDPETRREGRAWRSRPRREREASGGEPAEVREGSRRNRSRGGATLVFWILGAIAAAIAVVALVARARGYHSDVRLRERAPPRVTVEDEPLVLSEGPLDEARRLAAEGRFAEAIRLLLHRTFDALREQRGLELQPWLTGRELVDRAGLGPQLRIALHRLVQAVERTLFAREQAGEAEFARCVEDYERLLAHGSHGER